jgi:hypothetical protein
LFVDNYVDQNALMEDKMKKIVGLMVLAMLMAFVLGCQMPGSITSDTTSGWGNGNGGNTPALTADQAGVTFTLPSSGARSANITSAWAQTYANLYQLYVYDSTGTVLHSVPVTSGSINLAINMSTDSALYKVVVVAGHSPYPNDPSGYPAYLLGAGTQTVTLTKGQVTPISITLHTADMQVPGATPATTGQVMNGTVTGSYGITELSLRFGNKDFSIKGMLGSTSIGTPVQIDLNNDTINSVKQPTFTGHFSITMPVSLPVDPSTVTLWYSSNCLVISEFTSEGGFANINKLLCDGVTGWVLPTTWQWRLADFVPPFAITTPIAVTYGATQLAGTIGW